MPYKHIAAHLKKTELACRLHYHQLSHGSNRRKRTRSVSSGSSNGQSPLMPLSAQSSVHEAPTSRSSSPPGSAGAYAPASPRTSGGVQLPSIVGSHASPRLPAILPKPAAMTLPPLSASPTRSYPTPLPEPQSAALPSATFPSLSANPTTPPLRLECPVLPPPSARHTHVDMPRLQAVYTAHRAGFWATVAADYGGNVNPATLEQAWKAGGCCSQQQGAAPLTPAASPDNSAGEGKDRTRISAILGMEAHPRSPQDQQMVRRMDEERCVVAASA